MPAFLALSIAFAVMAAAAVSGPSTAASTTALRLDRVPRYSSA